MLSFFVFANLHPRRPPLFTSIGKVTTVPESPSPAPATAHIPPPRNYHTRHSPASTSHSFAVLSFHALTNCKFCNSFLLTFIQNAGGCTPWARFRFKIHFPSPIAPPQILCFLFIAHTSIFRML